jgi:hypothetical protein
MNIRGYVRRFHVTNECIGARGHGPGADVCNIYLSVYGALGPVPS